MIDQRDGVVAMQPVQVVRHDTVDNSFVLNTDVLSELLCNEKVKNKDVVVVSVAGAFRKGKSFLLNFFIRYLIYVESLGEKARTLTPENDDGSWMGAMDAPLSGFSWRGGSERDTNGVMLWSQPFCVHVPDGREVIVLLMDTQGAFDSNSTVKECATIFAISTMISSIQIYNISSNLQEDYLDHLQLFTEYGRIALESCNVKPFQKLLFLIRDWSYPYEFEYGFSPTFLEKKLTVFENQPPELQYVRQHIKDCFEEVELFLLPHPGSIVATSPSFNGSLAQMDVDFRKHLCTLVTTLLAPSQLRAKVDQGNPIKCGDLLAYFQSYMKIFQSNSLPEPKSMLVATAEANHLVALGAAKQMYMDEMNKICAPGTPFIPSEVLGIKHRDILSATLNCFSNCKKMGNEEFSKYYRLELEEFARNSYQDFIKINSNKQINSTKFIVLAAVVSIISFTFSQFLDLVGLDPLMLPFNLISLLFLILMLVCIYLQFSGGHTNLLFYFDVFTDYVTSMVREFVLQKALFHSTTTTTTTTISSTKKTD